MSEIGEKRYFEITKSIYKVLDERLANNKFLAGDNYSIADIATWPWIARHHWHDIGLKKYTNLCNWYQMLSERPAVIKGYKFMDGFSEKYQNLNRRRKLFPLFRVFPVPQYIRLLLVWQLIF